MWRKTARRLLATFLNSHCHSGRNQGLTRPAGRVGVVAHSPIGPEHSYRVRFTDGVEESFRRADFTIFRQLQREVPGAPDATDLYKFVAYRCIVGSAAYGLSQEGSDIDRRGVLSSARRT